MCQDIAAEEIAEDLLYRTGKAMIDGDEDLILFCFAAPVFIETSEGQSLLRTPQEILETFRRVRAVLKADGAVEIVRTVVSAEFLSSETIGSTHVSSLMRADGTKVRNPFPSYSILRRFGEVWKIVSATYAILDSDAHNRALSGVIENDATVRTDR